MGPPADRQQGRQQGRRQGRQQGRQQAGEPTGRGRFHTTRWSLVVSAGHDDKAGREALAMLCQRYWYPLYAWLRRQGRDPDQALDLTQGFFTRMLETGDFHKARADRGRFRGYVLTCLQHYVANEWHRQQAQKRGGGVDVLSLSLSLDPRDAESRYRLEPTDDTTPERLYDRRWALTLLDNVAERLATEMQEKERAGRGLPFERLKVYLDGAGPAHADLAAELGSTEGAVKTAVHRLRRRFKELLRGEIRETLADPDEVDDELAHLLDALRG